MILFKNIESLVDFLEKNLPEKIKDEICYHTYKYEHNGKIYENKQYKRPVGIINPLREMEFVIGLTDNPDRIIYPDHYILLWTKIRKFIEKFDTLTIEQEKYALITINQACKMLNVTRPTVYKIINENKIPFVEILSQKRIQLKDLLDYIDANKKFK
jgi:excisionase family DNA binding protein